MTNSERGKIFRARRKKFILRLEDEVAALRIRVAELELTRSLLRDGRQLHTARYSPPRPLVRITRDYFSFCRHGLRENSNLSQVDTFTSKNCEGASTRENFLKSIKDENVRVGEFTGAAVANAHWRSRPMAHDHVRCEIVSVKTYGSEDLPVVEVVTEVSETISNETFRTLFPGVVNRGDLKLRFLGKEVKYSCRHVYEFTGENEVAVERVEIDLIRGLEKAGCRIRDIAELMNHCVVSPFGVTPDPKAPMPRELPVLSKPHDAQPSKLCLRFLLDD